MTEMFAFRNPEPTMMKASAAQKHPDRGIALAALPLEHHQEMADRQQHRAELHRLALSQIPVGEIAAEDGGDIDQRGVGRIDQVRPGIAEQPVLGEIQDQQRAHPVIGKPFPHFGKEQHEQAVGMAQKLAPAPSTHHVRHCRPL